MLVPPSVEFKVDVDRQRCKVAHRADHCVPVFQEQVEITSGLPVVPARSEDAKAPPESLRLASAGEGRKDLENGSQVLVERGSKTFQVTDKLHLTLKTTWLVNMAEWFLMEEQVQWQTLANRTAELPHVAHSLVTLFKGPDPQARRAGQEAPEAPTADEDGDWVDDLPPMHFLTHIPKSQKCNVCLRAKLLSAPHRRRQNQSEHLQNCRRAELPEGPME